MLKPQPTDTNASGLNPDNMRILELQFDDAITKARHLHKWPAVVHNTRDTATLVEIDATIEKYREVGWVVTTGRPANNVRALLSPATHLPQD